MTLPQDFGKPKNDFQHHFFEQKNAFHFFLHHFSEQKKRDLFLLGKISKRQLGKMREKEKEESRQRERQKLLEEKDGCQEKKD